MVNPPNIISYCSIFTIPLEQKNVNSSKKRYVNII